MHISRILCPTDFSEPSYKALAAACEFAVSFSAELVVLHVVSPLPFIPSSQVLPSFDAGLYLEESKVQAEDFLANLMKTSIPASVAGRHIIVEGDPATEVVRIAGEETADMIVIATHGRTGWSRLLFGSVTEKVVRLSTVPVLVIHAPAGPE